MNKASYFVLKDNDPVVLQVKGRANFENCLAARNFLFDRSNAGQNSFVIDLKECRGADSTFLGILAGLSNNVNAKGGSVLLTRPSEIVQLSVRHLGLDKLLKLSPTLDAKTQGSEALPEKLSSELEKAKLALQSHEELLKNNPDATKELTDVVAYLKDHLKKHA